MSFYVDEFRLPTDKAYICNVEPIVGIFSNSAVTDGLCHLTVLEDENDICFLLFEYGTNQVKNIYSDARYYNIMILEETSERSSLQGYMPAEIGDRIVFDNPDLVRNALKKNQEVRFYIEEKDNPINNYLFTIESTAGFSEQELVLQNYYNELEYQEAIRLFNAGHYSQALLIFNSLDTYKDSSSWDTKYREIRYNDAVKLLADKEYTSANQAFIDAGNFGDAESRIGEPFYIQGKELLTTGDYVAANIAFTSAGDYSDASTMAKEALYREAGMLVSNGEHAEAIQIYQSLGEYSDSIAQLNMTRYSYAAELLAQGDYSNAKEQYVILNDYEDSKTLVSECDYQIAKNHFDKGEYSDAIEILTGIANYSDSSDMLTAAYSLYYYQQGCIYYSESKYHLAIENFEKSQELTSEEMIQKALNEIDYINSICGTYHSTKRISYGKTKKIDKYSTCTVSFDFEKGRIIFDNYHYVRELSFEYNEDREYQYYHSYTYGKNNTATAEFYFEFENGKLLHYEDSENYEYFKKQ